MLEKQIEEYLTREIRKMGGRTYKFVSPGNAGVPDRIVFLPQGRSYFIELKTDTNQATAQQKIQIKRLVKLGQDARVVRGLDGVKAFLNEVRQCNT